MCSKINGAMSKGPRNQCELPSSDQTWGQFQHQNNNNNGNGLQHTELKKRDYTFMVI